MGGKESKQDTGALAADLGVSDASDINTEKLRSGFRSIAKGSERLSRPHFNEALRLLEELGLRRLSNTPLGNRLFDIFDRNGNGQVDEDEFVNGCSSLMSPDQANKLDLTFQAYDLQSRGVVSKSDVVKIMTDSWTAAFERLADRVKQDPRMQGEPRRSEVIGFAQRNADKMRQTVENSFDNFDRLRKGTLDKSEFSQWAMAEDRTIVARASHLTVQVAVVFVNIEKRTSVGGAG
uniref:EF-hand domain-containing protein n=1 Tax=Chromera velia CCMP2878 TaxID=1169474 RepID=A0A0G4HA28_9ALVE|mmetsp:Transcript_44383/g.87708  ORF Transcript_44383/g.87708 Transcript_44383/m.87708 type:complete len:235 (-) Transcript_44383:140-844(-)|eukprot:Cvel_6000.t1-p1 / transcript=Cvel_6000.t1 / gene=Cvel_6000 / organism=Chromera_velia_CCMP2878 / gene_product=Recoverin family protein DDB_G0274781, putative / transcript_product=Recoverin family protein DDB_G0274781, putative / location=Cvel_scaffold287:42424-45624(-) / protein_length=234 / sequence_SO=supercontig / SO=protein_coding / is_pseudo=false